MLTITAAHGLTDLVIGLNDNQMWLIYSFYICMSIISPQIFVMFMFLWYSVQHFSYDLYIWNAVIFTLIAPLWLFQYKAVYAYRFMLSYLTFIVVTIVVVTVRSII